MRQAGSGVRDDGRRCSFRIEIDRCARSGGRLEIIASIEQPAVIVKVLARLERTAPDSLQPERPLGPRAPPGTSSLL